MNTKHLTHGTISAAILMGALAFGPQATASADGYPYPNAPDCTEAEGSYVGCVADQWGFFQGQCTSHVAWKLNLLNGISFVNGTGSHRWSDASNWANAARHRDIAVDNQPALGAVAHWDDGHVAYVEQVIDNNTIRISEMNYDSHNGRREIIITRGGYEHGMGWPNSFIHIADRDEATTGFVGKIVRNQDTGEAYLVKEDGRRYPIPTGGDYEALTNNGIVVVNLSNDEIAEIPTGSGDIVVRRVDDAAISGPSKWLTRRSNTSHGFDGDYTITQSAAGKSYVTNEATWAFRNLPDGVYRVKVFVPTREAVANVQYRIYDGSDHEHTASAAQTNIFGWHTLGEIRVDNGSVTIKLADNSGSGPYNAIIGIDAAEVVPLR